MLDAPHEGGIEPLVCLIRGAFAAFTYAGSHVLDVPNRDIQDALALEPGPEISSECSLNVTSLPEPVGDDVLLDVAVGERVKVVVLAAVLRFDRGQARRFCSVRGCPNLRAGINTLPYALEKVARVFAGSIWRLRGAVLSDSEGLRLCRPALHPILENVCDGAGWIDPDSEPFKLRIPICDPAIDRGRELEIIDEALGDRDHLNQRAAACIGRTL